MSYSPETGLVYIPAVEGSFAYVSDSRFEFIPRAWNLGIDLAARGGGDGTPVLPESAYDPGTGEAAGAASSLLAWDPAAGQARWRVLHTTATGGGTLATAGNLVFQGLSDGRFVAYSADRGSKLWEAQLGNGILAAPSTYALDGKQYVSVLVGWGGASGLYVGSPAGQYKAGGKLFTFVLDGKAELEPARGIALPALTAIAHEATPEQVARGSGLFGSRCSMCHGINAVSGGTIADLRYAAPATFDMFDRIVRQGAYQGLGMPMFDFLSQEDVAAIKSFVLGQRAALTAPAPAPR
jgi:quinohemoprotein ethanol dehydrogenase